MKNPDQTCYLYKMKLQEAIMEIPFVKKIIAIDINNNKIEKINFGTENLGQLTLLRLSRKILPDLYEFYFSGLSVQAQLLFPPYPLFKPPIVSINDLITRFLGWKKEKDWFFFVLKNTSKILGVSVLKKLDWPDDPNSPNRAPTSGVAVREKYHRSGLGFILMKVVELQASLYGARKIFVTIREDNLSSILLHKKCGFVETGKRVKRYDEIDKTVKIDIEFALKIARDDNVWRFSC